MVTNSWLKYSCLKEAMKTRLVEELIRIKSVVAQNPHVGLVGATCDISRPCPLILMILQSSLHRHYQRTATAGSDVVQSGRPIFDDFFQHLWPYIGNNTANVVFQMVKRLWLIRIDQ
ncbi:hypothetical protein TNCV_4510431 [Trichonephila clavipes]|nr:hypothetical protein TNCV_4510431 [Trichonephila clavipes]